MLKHLSLFLLFVIKFGSLPAMDLTEWWNREATSQEEWKAQRLDTLKNKSVFTVATLLIGGACFGLERVTKHEGVSFKAVGNVNLLAGLVCACVTCDECCQLHNPGYRQTRNDWLAQIKATMVTGEAWDVSAAKDM